MPAGLVWAHLRGFPWWPASVAEEDNPESIKVIFLGTQDHATVTAAQVLPFVPSAETEDAKFALPKKLSLRPKFSAAIQQANAIVAAAEAAQVRAAAEAAAAAVAEEDAERSARPCFIVQCGGECGERVDDRSEEYEHTVPQLQRSTCVKHGRGRKRKSFDSTRLLSRIHDKDLIGLLQNGRMRKQLDFFDPSFGWKYPRGTDSGETARFFREDADHGYLCVSYDNLTDDDDDDALLVLWKEETPPLVSNELHSVPVWAENGVKLVANVKENRLTCLAPLTRLPGTTSSSML